MLGSPARRPASDHVCTVHPAMPASICTPFAAPTSCTAELIHQRRFQAVLLSRGTESTFQIVETNDFKQLAHISLAFKPGCNATVKNVRLMAAVHQ